MTVYWIQAKGPFAMHPNSFRPWPVRLAVQEAGLSASSLGGEETHAGKPADDGSHSSVPSHPYMVVQPKKPDRPVPWKLLGDTNHEPWSSHST